MGQIFHTDDIGTGFFGSFSSSALGRTPDRPNGLIGAALRLLTRPCRVETGGWAEGAPASDAAGEAVARDYFMAQGAAQELLWVYRERPTSRTPASAAPRWFLHGIYA